MGTSLCAERLGITPFATGAPVTTIHTLGAIVAPEGRSEHEYFLCVATLPGGSGGRGFACHFNLLFRTVYSVQN
jgi:hypothetical protein